MRADIWQVGHDHIDVYLPPDSDRPSLFSSHELQYTDSVLHNDLFRLPQQSSQAYWNLSSLTNTTFHTAYHPLEDIHTFVKELLDLHPDNVKLVPIGHSAENREMFALEIFKDQRTKAKKTGFVITGAQHAREVCRVLYRKKTT